MRLQAFPFRLLISSLAIVISLGLLTYDFTALNREWTSPPKPFVALQPDIATTYKHFVQPSATTINSLASVQAVTIDPCANQVIESKIGAPVNGTHVLVTGGAGFIGSTLTDRLLKLGYKVRIFDNLATGSLRNVPLGNDHLEFVLGDIMNQKDVYNAMDGIDYVFHLAAMSKVVPSLKSPAMAKFCTEVNALGTWNVLESARLRKVKKVIYAASSTFYGGNPLPNTETDAPDFLTPYAASKYEGELQMQTFNNVFNLPTISLRFFMVYGPRQPSTGAYAIVTGVFAKQAGLGEPLTIEGTGNHSRDFIHVDDIAEGLIIAQQSSLSGQVINLGTGVGYSVQQVADLVSKNQVHVSERKNDLNATLADTCKMKNVLGFQPKKDFVVEMSRVAKETMGGSVFAQTWVDKDVIVAVPWLLPARYRSFDGW
ncbi:NAD(P)-binding protein [Rhizoclosmatium globosum]|uniref:NAD(P)-binding protein n=1 Tax=Rhizoclosmatium globosum TaxID=329046 RepID=A0A1Y2B6M4_9FUNG|nr:NAD(P)-binding protein [Rhizoclosmatium globosum]|eukprot:ORY30498.1 NAD(P)-binding protein [Rhizoclosmatium globosum]